MKYTCIKYFSAIATLQHVIASDFKPTDIEVAFVGKNEQFQAMAEKDIEEILQTIAERE